MKQPKKLVTQVTKLLDKFKYSLIVLAVGIVLMIIPVGTNKHEASDETPAPVIADLSFQKEMEQILREIDGAGDVSVMLSVDKGARHIFQEDVQTVTQSDEKTMQTQTVLLSGNGAQMPIEVMTEYPVYRGVLVVCQGAAKPSVKLSIIQAVSSLTGLGSEDITVIKMKSN